MENRIAQPSFRVVLPPRLNPRASAEASVEPAEKHPVLSRLLEEVRNERRVEAAYDRVHNRHNRGR